jgi:hypothetical protein
MLVYIVQIFGLAGLWYFAKWVAANTDWFGFALVMAAIFAVALAMDRWCSPFPPEKSHRRR